MRIRNAAETAAGPTVFVLIIGGFLAISIGLTSLLRNHGIDSCKARGGTPIVRSWISPEAWDVACIRNGK